MNIREDRIKEDRERQQAQIAERRNKEAEARPDVAHRALIFALTQIAMNNRDAKPEADYFIAELDREGADLDKLAELQAPPAAPAAPAETGANDSQPTQGTPAKDTAASLRQSKRFRRTS